MVSVCPSHTVHTSPSSSLLWCEHHRGGCSSYSCRNDTHSGLVWLLVCVLKNGLAGWLARVLACFLAFRSALFFVIHLRSGAWLGSPSPRSLQAFAFPQQQPACRRHHHHGPLHVAPPPSVRAWPSSSRSGGSHQSLRGHKADNNTANENANTNTTPQSVRSRGEEASQPQRGTKTRK